MDEEVETGADEKRRKRIVGQLDKMVGSGQLTDQEAARLRAASSHGQFDAVVSDIRVRHARTRLDAAVADGAMSQEEAEGFLDRLRNGEHPRSLRAQLAELRPREHSRAKASGPGTPP